MDSANIFYDAQKKLAGDASPFDCRYDAQALPAHSVPCGFMVHQGPYKPISELLDPPAMTPEQEAQFQAVCQEARATLSAGEPLPTKGDVLEAIERIERDRKSMVEDLEENHGERLPKYLDNQALAIGLLKKLLAE